MIPGAELRAAIERPGLSQMLGEGLAVSIVETEKEQMGRTEMIAGVVSPEEKEAVEAAADHLGLTVSAFVRRCALAGMIHVAEELRAEGQEQEQQVKEATG